MQPWDWWLSRMPKRLKHNAEIEIEWDEDSQNKEVDKINPEIGEFDKKNFLMDNCADAESVKAKDVGKLL